MRSFGDKKRKKPTQFPETSGRRRRLQKSDYPSQASKDDVCLFCLPVLVDVLEAHKFTCVFLSILDKRAELWQVASQASTPSSKRTNSQSCQGKRCSWCGQD